MNKNPIYSPGSCFLIIKSLKFKSFIALTFICTIYFSCQSSKIKSEAEEKTKQFFVALKSGDEKLTESFYPGFENFDSYSKSDSARITGTDIKDSLILVFVHNRFTNPYGKIFERNITMYLKRNSKGELILFDSKGLTDFSEKDNYNFGIKTGCINKDIDTTDQLVLKALKKTHLVLMDKAVEFYIILKSEVRVVTWNWESGYGGSASGKGIVKNNSELDIPDLRYKIIYKDNAGNEITSDKGSVAYDKIEAGGSRSFIFYTSYIGNASRATIDLTFDNEFILKYMAAKNWSGKECDQFFKNNPEKLKEL